MTADEKRRRISKFFEDQIASIREYLALRAPHTSEMVFRCSYTLQVYQSILANISQHTYINAHIALEMLKRGLKRYDASYLTNPKVLSYGNFIALLDDKSIQDYSKYLQSLMDDLMSLIDFSDVTVEI